jgi:hypothetical protein
LLGVWVGDCGCCLSRPGDVDCDWCVRASGGGATIGGVAGWSYCNTRCLGVAPFWRRRSFWRRLGMRIGLKMTQESGAQVLFQIKLANRFRRELPLKSSPVQSSRMLRHRHLHHSRLQPRASIHYHRKHEPTEHLTRACERLSLPAPPVLSTTSDAPTSNTTLPPTLNARFH